MPREKQIKIPKDPAACADLLYSTREKRHVVQHEVEQLKELEGALEEFFVNRMGKGTTGIAGRVARVQISTTTKPVVENWDAFYAHIRKTGAFELMQRRVSEKAVEERWEDKKSVPGIGKFNVKKVSCTKLKGA